MDVPTTPSELTFDLFLFILFSVNFCLVFISVCPLSVLYGGVTVDGGKRYLFNKVTSYVVPTQIYKKDT